MSMSVAGHLALNSTKKTSDLYIADAYFGMMKVGPEGGLATSLATETEEVPLTFTNNLDIGDDGVVYFKTSSTNYQRRSQKGERVGFRVDATNAYFSGEHHKVLQKSAGPQSLNSSYPRSINKRNTSDYHYLWR